MTKLYGKKEPKKHKVVKIEVYTEDSRHQRFKKELATLEERTLLTNDVLDFLCFCITYF